MPWVAWVAVTREFVAVSRLPLSSYENDRIAMPLSWPILVTLAIMHLAGGGIGGHD